MWLALYHHRGVDYRSEEATTVVIEGFEGELIAADAENVIRPWRTFGKPSSI